MHRSSGVSWLAWENPSLIGVQLLNMLQTFVHALAGTSAKQHWELQGKEGYAVSLLLL
jgi:hypothetical protein